MSDIFREVDEEVRRERLKQLWDQYGTLVVVVAFLIVAGIGGWRAYQWYEAKQAAEQGGRFEAALGLETKGNHQEAEAAFAKLAADGTSGYRTLARLQEASEVSRRDGAAAVRLFDALASDSSVSATMQDLARVRAGMLLVDTAPYEDLRGRLEPLTAQGRTFRHTARELLAFSAWRSGDQAATTRWFEAIASDPESPAGTRSRVEMLIALGAAGAKS